MSEEDDLNAYVHRDWLWKKQVPDRNDKEAVKAAHKQFNDMKRFAGGIFQQLCVRSSSVDEAITMLYITGLYHGSNLEEKRTSNAQAKSR